MIVVTTRPAVRERVRAAAVVLGVGAPSFVERAAELAARGAGCQMVCLDLASCCGDADLVTRLRAWSALGPGRRLVIFAPLVERERELRVASALVRAVRRARVRVMTTSDFFDDRAWRRMRAAHERAWLETSVRARLLAAVCATGRPMPAGHLVLEVLREVSRYGVRRMPPPDPAAGMPVCAESLRKLRWRALRRAGQLPESWLRCVMRVLWYVTLRDAGWSTARIASSLGFRSPRHLRRAVRRRLGIPFRELRRLPLALGFAWAGGLLTGAGGRDAVRVPLRELATGLRAAVARADGQRADIRSSAR